MAFKGLRATPCEPVSKLGSELAINGAQVTDDRWCSTSRTWWMRDRKMQWRHLMNTNQTAVYLTCKCIPEVTEVYREDATSRSQWSYVKIKISRVTESKPSKTFTVGLRDSIQSIKARSSILADTLYYCPIYFAIRDHNLDCEMDFSEICSSYEISRTYCSFSISYFLLGGYCSTILQTALYYCIVLLSINCSDKPIINRSIRYEYWELVVPFWPTARRPRVAADNAFRASLRQSVFCSGGCSYHCQ